MQELRPGLWRWTGLHPGWSQSATQADWGPEVGSVYYEAPEEVVLVDPLVPPEDEERFLAALDRDVERLARPVAIVLTCAWHRRSSDAIAQRYGARIGGQLPAGVDAFRVEPYEEAPVWIAEHRTLLLGDALVGTPLRKPSMHWVPNEWHGRYAEPLRFLLDLPVEIVLPSHGDAVTTDAHRALQAALDP